MNDNYTSDVRTDENSEGTVSFATDVVATIAGLAANEVEGVASMANVSAGISDILTRKSTRNLTKGVRVDIQENRVAVDVTIVVEYGSPVPDVARSIQENVKKAIETMSGLDVKNVDVHVQGVSFERENRATAELTEQHKKLLKESGDAAEASAKREKDAETKAEPEFTEEELSFDEDLPDVAEEPETPQTDAPEA